LPFFVKNCSMGRRMKTSLDIGTARLLSTGQLLPDARWHMKAHSHSFHELIVVLGGGMTVEHAGRRTVAVTGDVMLYPAGLVHAERSDPKHPVESRFMVFRCDGLAGGPLVRVTDERGRIRQMVRWLHDDGHATSALIQVERQAMFQAVLAEFFHEAGPGDPPLVANTRRYVREHLGDSLVLDDLARAAGLSKSYFVRTYGAATGRTPMQDVRALRAGFARELILGTNLPLKEIAPRAGLGNEYSMSRLFRQLFHMPPGQYRRFHGRRQRSEQ